MLRTLVISLLLSGCYSPELADCAVVCQDSGDCSGDQSCVAGWCTASAACGSDAGNGNTPDASPMITLTTSIMGEGKIVIANVGECSNRSPGRMCMWSIAPGAYNFTAVETNDDHEFEKWTSPACAGQDTRCRATLSANTTVSVKFK